MQLLKLKMSQDTKSVGNLKQRPAASSLKENTTKKSIGNENAAQRRSQSAKMLKLKQNGLKKFIIEQFLFLVSVTEQTPNSMKRSSTAPMLLSNKMLVQSSESLKQIESSSQHSSTSSLRINSTKTSVDNKNAAAKRIQSAKVQKLKKWFANSAIYFE
jgi:hypothetical protein